MKETIRAFCILERNQLLPNAEKAARVLGIWGVVKENSTDGLWEIATREDVPVSTTSLVGSEPKVLIETEDPPGGQAPGVKPTAKKTRTIGK